MKFLISLLVPAAHVFFTEAFRNSSAASDLMLFVFVVVSIEGTKQCV